MNLLNMVLCDVDVNGTVDVLQNGDSKGGIFAELISKVVTVGSDAYTLVTTCCVILLLLCVAVVGISFSATKSGAKREDNKSWVFWMAVGGIFVFGAGTIVELIAAIVQSI